MAVDIRGRIECNLGTLISASLNDSYLPGAGIIKTTGFAIITGELESFIGDDIQFTVIPPGNGLKYRIPRYVKLVSARYNPVERTTRCELACNWALRETWAENIIWTPEDDPKNQDDPLTPENEGYTQGDYDIVTAPIYGSSVLKFCLGKLGLVGIDSEVASQKFSRPEFDFSPGYVQIASDLLLSLGLVGIGLGDNIVAAVEPFLASAVAITEQNLISLEPTGSGVPPSGVLVEYETLKLREPDTEDIARNNWEVEEVLGAPTTVRISYKEGDELWSSSFAYIPYQKIWRKYDEWNRLVESVTLNRSIGAAVAASYCQALIDDDFKSEFFILGRRSIAYGNQIFDTVTTVDVKYVLDAPLVITYGQNRTPLAGYEEVESETQSTYKAVAEVLCSVAPGFFDEDDNLINIGPGYEVNGVMLDIAPNDRPPLLVERTTTTYEQSKRNVTVAVAGTATDEESNESYSYTRLGYFPVTKTITQSAKCYGLTSRGQQDIATRVDQGETLEDIARDVLAFSDDGTEVRIVSGREAVLQARPSAADRILAQNADTSGNTADNGYSTVEESETVLVEGGAGGGLFPLRLRIPYVSDDTFVRSGVPPSVTYSVEPAEPKPEEAALEFGRTQSALVIGSQLGATIQCAANALGGSPVGPVVVKLGGSSAGYLKNGVTYTLSSEGAIASADLIARGNSGGDIAWLPKPENVLLPNLPTITSTAPTTVLGTIATVGSDPQAALNAAFSTAEAGDGVLALDTYFYWLYTGTTWNNVGLTPGDIVADPVVVPMFEEIVLLRGTVRSKLNVTRIPYALELLTEVEPLVVTLGVTAARVKLLTSEAGALTLSGQPAALLRRYRMVSQAGGFALIGFGAGSVRDYAIGTNAGTFTAAGQPAALVAERLPLIAEAGVFTLDGEDASLRAVQPLPAEVGTFTLEGEAANFIRQLKLDGAPASLVLTGNAAQLFVNDYFSSWATQTYGYESLVYPDWWAE
jgi:hypothetical protein